MLAVRNPFELFESDVVLECDVLDPAVGNALCGLVAPDNWRSLSI